MISELTLSLPDFTNGGRLSWLESKWLRPVLRPRRGLTSGATRRGLAPRHQQGFCACCAQEVSCPLMPVRGCRWVLVPALCGWVAFSASDCEHRVSRTSTYNKESSPAQENQGNPTRQNPPLRDGPEQSSKSRRGRPLERALPAPPGSAGHNTSTLLEPDRSTHSHQERSCIQDGRFPPYLV